MVAFLQQIERSMESNHKETLDSLNEWKYIPDAFLLLSWKEVEAPQLVLPES